MISQRYRLNDIFSPDSIHLRIVSILLLAVLPVFLVLFNYNALIAITRHVGGDLMIPDNNSTETIHLDNQKLCEPCEYLMNIDRQYFNESESIIMNSTLGFGRTGNYLVSIKKALARAYDCKLKISLPVTDEKSHAISPNLAMRHFDFSERPGKYIHPDCLNRNVGKGLKGDSKTFWNLPDLKYIRGKSSYENFFSSRKGGPFGNKATDICLRWYLQICGNFCSDLHLDDDTLVAHIRQGDVFKPGWYSRHYFQPPLSYYLAAFTFRDWKRIIVVARKERFSSPAFDMLKRLNQFGLLSAKFEFHSSSVLEDMRLLVCARNIVESHSTLSNYWMLGFSRNVFTHKCKATNFKWRNIYSIEPLPQYKAESQPLDDTVRLDMLFHESHKPGFCKN